MTMTKSDLIDALAADTGLTKADADRFLKSFTSNIEKTLKRGAVSYTHLTLPTKRIV